MNHSEEKQRAIEEGMPFLVDLLTPVRELAEPEHILDALLQSRPGLSIRKAKLFLPDDIYQRALDGICETISYINNNNVKAMKL